MSDKLDKLYNELSGLTVLEVAELVKLLEDKWGVSAAAPVAVAAAPAGSPLQFATLVLQVPAGAEPPTPAVEPLMSQ